MVSSLGMFFAELTGSPLAILIQGVWWFADVFAGSGANLAGGNFGLHLILRYNTTGERELFTEHLFQMGVNRVFYTVLALVFLIFASLIYNEKRKGRLDFRGKIRSYRKSKSEV